MRYNERQRVAIAPHYYASRASAARFVGPLQSESDPRNGGIPAGRDRKRHRGPGVLRYSACLSFLSSLPRCTLSSVIIAHEEPRARSDSIERGHSPVSTCPLAEAARISVWCISARARTVLFSREDDVRCESVGASLTPVEWVTDTSVRSLALLFMNPVARNPEYRSATCCRNCEVEEARATMATCDVRLMCWSPKPVSKFQWDTRTARARA